MSRAAAQTLLPADVEAEIHKRFIGQLYSYKVKHIVTWAKSLDITPTVEHVGWDDNMWRMGSDIGNMWEQARISLKPKEAKTIQFDKPTLIQCPACHINISPVPQARNSKPETRNPKRLASHQHA